MDPFAAALDALFIAPGSVAAVYASGDGSAPPTGVRTIRDQRTEEMPIGSGPVPTNLNLLLLRRSEVAVPAAGDRLQVGNFVGVAPGDPLFEIMGEPWLDTEGLTWSCEMRPIS
ncbi:head-tail joining protein [Sphingomonas hylomeconis]|uniref:Uncharacterized protein n=1 Tax=Sphingomonas hylomeconis TaxID=1395958 RepID=A0ABV7SQI0_9SPHN|nr:hypothetical protein [Sphingomonas hylomeconis]